jgi:hypothetical protein
MTLRVPPAGAVENPRAAVTKAENAYDYAGQDPINGYDLDGTMMQDVDGGPAPRSLAGCGGPSCEEDEAGGTTAAEMVERATRDGRGSLVPGVRVPASAWRTRAEGGTANLP